MTFQWVRTLTGCSPARSWCGGVPNGSRCPGWQSDDQVSPSSHLDAAPERWVRCALYDQTHRVVTVTVLLCPGAYRYPACSPMTAARPRWSGRICPLIATICASIRLVALAIVYALAGLGQTAAGQPANRLGSARPQMIASPGASRWPRASIFCRVSGESSPETARDIGQCERARRFVWAAAAQTVHVHAATRSPSYARRRSREERDAWS